MKTSVAIAALVATAIGFGAVLPTLAQDAAPPAPPSASAPTDQGTAPADKTRHRDFGNRYKGNGMDDRGIGRGGLIALACSPNAAEELDVAFVRAQHRLELTADQQKLFDAFRTKALTTQTSFADACKTAMPAANADKPDILARMKAGLAVDQARLTAMNEVLPDFEALFNSLTDTQKANLLPHRGFGKGPGMDRGLDGGRQGNRGGMERAPDPGRM